MASSPRIAVSGSLVDVKNVNTHKCVRLVIDVPAERAAEIVAAFGWPTMVNPVSVAIAKIHDQPEVASPDLQPKEAPKERARFKDLPLMQQAAMRCQEPLFRAFLETVYPLLGRVNDAEGAADIVRNFCRVSSRREIIAGTHAGNFWAHLEGRYDRWRTAEKAGVAP